MKARLLYESLACEYGGGQLESTHFAKFSGSLDLPESILQFFQSTKHIVDWTLQSIINDHTLYGFYKAFFTEGKRTNVLNAMIYGADGNIHKLAGINTTSLKRPTFPHFCPVCAQRDLSIFGQAYWHRIHQIPGIQICPEHQCLLREYQPTLEEMRGRKYYMLRPAMISQSLSEVRANACTSMLVVAREFEKILRGNTKFDVNGINYAPSLLQKGYYDKNRLRRTELCNQFQEFYRHTSNPLVKTLVSECYHWVGTLVIKPQSVFNPHQHILFNQFISSLKPLVFPRLEHPFGNGPWPCFNKVSNHYLKPVVISMNHHINKTNGRVVGVFTCSCGMIYSKSFTRKKKKVVEYIQVQEYGDLWKKKLNECISAGLQMRQTAIVLGTSSQTIYRLIKRKPKKNLANKKLKTKRGQWNKALKKFPFNCYTQARTRYPALYSWLYRADKEWLLATNLGANERANGIQLRFDWSKADDELCEEIKKAVSKIKGEAPERRIGKINIAKLVSKGKYIISTTMDRLPKSKEYLAKNTETTYDYQVRRIREAILKLTKTGKSITKWNVLRLASISRPSKEVLQFVESKVFRAQRL